MGLLELGYCPNVRVSEKGAGWPKRPAQGFVFRVRVQGWPQGIAGLQGGYGVLLGFYTDDFEKYSRFWALIIMEK